MSFLRKILFKKILLHTPDIELQSTWEKTQYVKDGRRLSVLHKKPSKSDIRGVVILCHPFRAESKDFYLQQGHADMYLEMGYHVFSFDFNGFGESPYLDYYFDDDILLVLSEIKNIYSDPQIIVHGISFGAAQLIRTLVRPQHGIHRAIIENSLTQYHHYFKKRKPAVFRLLQVMTPFFRTMSYEHNYLEKITRLVDISKVMLIYGSQDDLTTLDMGKELQAASNTDMEFIVYDCAHMKAIETDYEDYRKSILAYIGS